MRHPWLIAGLLAVAGCSMPFAMKPRPPAASAAKPDYFGTDQRITPGEPDAVLRYADHPRGFAELRLPKGAGPFPLAVIFHGGCWKAGIATQAYVAPLATRWQQLGIATLNVDYREVGDGGGWPGSFRDWNAAAQLIDRVAHDYPIDRARVTLVGHSAGALPALWLAEAQDADGPAGARPAGKAHAAVIFDGPADVGAETAAFDALCEFSSVAPFMGGTMAELPARYVALAPQHHAPALDQVLFVQAILPPPPAAAQDAIRNGGAVVSVRTNPGASHFEIFAPGFPAYDDNEAAVLAVLRGDAR